ncbi:hypothetical protein ASC81_19950 [Pelomonas sp. Root405]|nr:hypothetical protein ASC81_19950 [Pelomonas sp. Root405]
MESLDAGSVMDMEWTAADEAQVRAQARAQGLAVLAVHALQPADAPTRAAPRWKPTDLAWWCKELHTLVSAGMTAVEALETLQAQSLLRGTSDARSQIQAALVADLYRGLPLSQAMANEAGFPPVLVASVRAAERTSALSGALEDYLRYHEVLDQLRRRVISAAMYPLLVASVGFIVSVFLMVVVMPKFLGFLEGTRASQAPITSMLFAFSHWLQSNGILAAGLGLMAAAGLAWNWRAGNVGRALLWLGRQIPPLARTMWAFEMTQLYQSLALLYRGGYPIEEAVGICQASSQTRHAPIADSLERCQQALLRGQGLSRAFADAGLTDGVSVRLLAVGERSGGVHGILQAIAQRHAQIVADFVDRAMRIVEPLLLLLVATLVGSVVVLMYLPIFDIATGLPS